MHDIALRPLTLGELLDRAFTLYRTHFWLFVGIMAMPAAFSVPLGVLMFSVQGVTFLGAAASPGFAIGAGILAFVFLCLFWFVYSMAMAAATYAVSESYLGKPVTVRGSYDKVRGNFWKIVGVVVLASLRITGMMLLVLLGAGILTAIVVGVLSVAASGLPAAVRGIVTVLVLGAAYLVAIAWAVIWGLRYSVCIPALLLERQGVRTAISRSATLTQGRRRHIFVALLLCMLIAYTGAIVFQGPFYVAMMFSVRNGHPSQWLAFAVAVSGAIGGAVTRPLLLIVLVLCYYDARIRREAFDLQVMMDSLDGPEPSPETTPAA